MTSDLLNQGIRHKPEGMAESEKCNPALPSILHVCKVYLPVRGGVQIVVSRICNALSENFTNCVISTSEKIQTDRNRESENVTVVKSWGDILSMPVSPSFIPKLWKMAKLSGLLVIHYPFPLADIAIALARFMRLPPIVVYWHSEIVSQKISKLLIKPFTLQMLKRCRAIVVSSPNLIEHSTLLQKHKNKCIVIPFGYQPSGTNNGIIDGGYFLFVGRHVPYKGIEVLIRAVKQSRVKLVIVGDGPRFNINKALANSLNVGEQIEFRTAVDDTELEMLMRKCRALVLPSILSSEAFALVQIEAMCFGKPVINTNLKSGVPWVARHEQEGLTVVAGDVSDLSAALTRLQHDPVLLERLGQGAKKRWQDCFSMEQFKQSTSSLYSGLLQESGS